jgi:hypothetical protein
MRLTSGHVFDALLAITLALAAFAALWLIVTA